MQKLNPPPKTKNKKNEKGGVNGTQLNRVIDANFNRAKEGLRVCEDVCRFVINEKECSKKYKKVRHDLTNFIGALNIKNMISSRDIEGDVGRSSEEDELKRNRIEDIFLANSQRSKESMRVLEELSKLRNKNVALKIKNLRYSVYALEKKIHTQL